MSSVKRVKDEYAKVLKNALIQLDRNIVGKAGWFEDSKYPNGTSVALIAAQNEFGNAGMNIPPRPFMRPTLKEKESLLKAIAISESKAILKGKSSIDSALFKIGAKYVGEVKVKIRSIQNPPLKPSTIAARLNKKKNKKVLGNLSKPLVDSGIMLNTIVNKVEKE